MRTNVYPYWLQSTRIYQCAILAAGLLYAIAGQAGLVNQWTGDGYSSGNWVDGIGGVTATANGSPQAVANAFNTHAGVTMNGGYFLIPAGTTPAGLSNFTVVVVIKPTNVGPFTGNYFNAIPLAAFDIGGSGQIDWGLCWGGITGQMVVEGVGVQNAAGGANGDILQSTPTLALNTVHAIALQVRNDPVLGTNITTYADGAVVSSNNTVNVMPRSAASSVFVGGGTFVTARFPGSIAAIQIYNDSATNCAVLTTNLLTTYATPGPISLPYSSGGDVGQSAPVTIGIPASASAGGSFTVTLTSDNSSVVASTSTTFSQNQISKSINLPILALGTANVTATGSGVGSATMVIAGLDESGLVNDWLADNYVNNSTTWVDSVGSVTATSTGSEIAVANAFGTGHQGVSRNAGGTTTGTSGFIIPGGTAPGGLQTYTVAVAFKPTSVGPNTGNYFSGQIIFGYDIGGAGQADFGISWCGNNPATGQTAAGQRIVVGIGRSGGDSQIQGGLLALNVTHAVCLQVDATAHTQTLFIDGVQMGQNTGLTMNTVSSQAIPFLNQSSANIANAFPGLVAEARVYNSASVNGAALTGGLLNKYAGLPPISLASAQPYADVGSNVTVTVTIPASASLASAFPVTLTSDTPSVVGNSSVTVAKGTTTTNVSMTILGVGSAKVTASGSGVGSASITVGGLAPRRLVEALRASSLPAQIPSINDGDPLSNWYGDTNATTLFSYIGASNSPTYHASATLNGKPAASFHYGPMLLNTNTGAVSPLAGFTNFSVAMVFKSSAPGLGNPGVPWYNGVGVLDGDEAGAHPDFGMALDGSGNFIFGVGNPDASLTQTNNLLSPLFHAIVCAWDGLNQQMRLYIDDKPGTTLSGGTVPVGPRDDANIMLGGTASPPGTRTDPTQIYILGEFAEVRFYSGALSGAEATNVINSLQSSYGLLWPDQTAIALTAARTIEDVGSNILCTATIPQGVNASQSVTVNVASGNPSAVTVGGGSSINLVFAAGATNVQTFTASTVGAGASTITATSPGLVQAAITINVLGVPALVEAFRASSLPSQSPGIADGNNVTAWAGDTNSSAVANQSSTIAPTFHTPATPSGAPSVVFAGANSTSMLLLGANSPVGGKTNFSVALVFKASGPAASTSANWYSQTGIIDAEESGIHNDWGIALDGGGNLNFGVGNPDVTLLNPNYNCVNASIFHIAVMAFDLVHQRMQITIDDQPTTSTAQGTTLSTNPRDAVDDVHFGQGSTDGLFWTGELVEADFYDGAVKNPAAIINALKATYSIPFQSQVLMSLTPSVSAVSVGATENLTLTIPASANVSQSVTVYLTNSNPSGLTLNGSSASVVPVVFAMGAPNAQTVAAAGVTVGSVSLTYSAAGLVAGASPSILVIEAAGQSLVGEWTFNDNTHPYVDSSGFRPAGTHDGVAIGNVALSSDIPAGLTGYSLNLTNVGALQILNTRSAEPGYRSTYDDLLAEAMTIAVWVKLNASWDSTMWIPFVSKRGEDNAGYQLRRFNTGPFACFTIRGTPGADDPSGLTAYEDGNWHHIAGVWDGRTGVRSLYVDGFLDANASLTGDVGVPTFASTNNLVIGARDRSNDGSGTAIEGYFTGLLKDVRIYNYALSRAQVQRAMAGLVVYPEANLQIQHQGANVVVSWSQGKLLQATSVFGPWTTNSSATSPYTVGVTNSRTFFKVQISP
ncbi:MAG: hypothetical protein C5B50_24920 [Verrucomicrobia bacterium]|nr:MAG: hypothetical protein C5B50_24920 [Verrucomicrobiota bacterium]